MSELHGTGLCERSVVHKVPGGDAAGKAMENLHASRPFEAGALPD